MRFRKKPVVIEAVTVECLLAAAAEGWGGPTRLPRWAEEAAEDGTLRFLGRTIFVLTLEGEHRANEDDWILRGVKGELYPCKPDIFEATYDPVDDG